MYRNVIDVTTARKSLSSILDQVFLEDEEFIITKHNIPLVRVVRVGSFSQARKDQKDDEVDLSAFGLLAEDKRDREEIAREWRLKAWSRDDR